MTQLLEEFRGMKQRSGEETGKFKRNNARCWKCGAEGHLQRQCQARQDQRPRSLSRNNTQELGSGGLAGRRLPENEKPHFEVLQISSSSENGLFIEANVNGFPCRMVVDTGANVTILRQDLAQQLGVKILRTPPCVTLQTVKGDKIPIIGKMHITIKFGNVLYGHTVFVAEITDIFILGLDFLTKHNFVIDFENNVLRSNSEDVALFQLGAVEREPCHRITCKSDITIPARIEMLVRGAAEKSQNFRHGLTEFPDSENFPKGVLVASALVDLSKETVPVRVVNLTGNPKTIRKGDVLATCAPVTSH
ncbi:uncharacterized protein LOC129962327 [Argiope bruennichi]|uniref:uncharacterized protein LOC129962327 n=1 Tax=Argiope bruennichi TaxID=94029 RepID=UPI002493E5AE|nr:uncharacterized protein LOC129962327 [Argiope bruennichi]